MEIKTNSNKKTAKMIFAAMATTTAGAALMSTTHISAHADNVHQIQNQNNNQNNGQNQQQTVTTDKYYVVQNGDTLSSVAQKNGISLNDLFNMNKQYNNNNTVIKAGDKIKVGQTTTTQNAPGNKDQHPGEVLVNQTVTKTTTNPDGSKSVNQYTVQKWVPADQAHQTTTSTESHTVSQISNNAVTNGQSQSGNTQQAPQNWQNVQANSDTAKKIVAEAEQLASENIPYVWGGTSTSGFDCSGLVQYVLGQQGINIGRCTTQQETHVQKKAVDQAQPGDLLFWGNPGSTYHVAIYIGNGEYIAAPEPGQNVQIQHINSYFAPSFAGSVPGVNC